MKYSSPVIFLIIGIIVGVIPTFFFTKSLNSTNQNVDSSTFETFENPDEADINKAKEAAINFLSKLHEKQYEEASRYYGSDYDQLREWNPSINQDDYKELWKNGCEINGLNCLEIRNLEGGRQEDGTYIVYVWFSNEDGTEFLINTSEGSSPEETSQNVFAFTVTQSEDGSFKVQTMPPYTP